jgi:hypothetical protein
LRFRAGKIHFHLLVVTFLTLTSPDFRDKRHLVAVPQGEKMSLTPVSCFCRMPLFFLTIIT